MEVNENIKNNKPIRELPFDSLFIITEMLEKMEFDIFIEGLENKLQKMEEEGQEKIKKQMFGNSNEELKKEQEAKKKLAKEKQTKLAMEALKFITLRPHKAKKEVFELVSSFSGMEIENVKKQGLKWVINTFKELFKNGIWDVVQEASGGKLQDLKKTLL